MNDASEHIRVSSLTDEVYQRLRHSLITGDFRPGDALREPELVERFNVSRTPLREALRRLHGGGLVEILPRLGARVRRLSLEEARDLHEVRRILEGQSAALAAQRGDRAALAVLWDVVGESTTLGGPTPRSLLVNQGFHEGIAWASGNARLAHIILEAIDLTSLWRMGALDRGASFRGTVEEHRAILAAVEQGDAAVAQSLMEAHIDASWTASQEMMTESGKGQRS
jgi:DNA-binding GntR family transcriptional regulator